MGHKFSSSKEDAKGSTPSVLHKQSFARCQDQISEIEKWPLALVMTAQKFRLYFLAHPMVVMID